MHTRYDLHSDNNFSSIHLLILSKGFEEKLRLCQFDEATSFLQGRFDFTLLQRLPLPPPQEFDPSLRDICCLWCQVRPHSLSEIKPVVYPNCQPSPTGW